MITKEIIDNVRNIIEESEYLKNCYFWSAPSSARERRAYEMAHSHPMTEWTDGKHKYTAEYSVSCSCTKIYAQGIYTRDGKKTTLTAIKNSYNRIKEEFNKDKF